MVLINFPLHYKIINGNILFTAGFTTVLPYLAFARYSSITGAVFDTKVGLYTVTASQYSKMQSLIFVIDGHKYTLTPDAVKLPIYSVLSAC